MNIPGFRVIGQALQGCLGLSAAALLATPMAVQAASCSRGELQAAVGNYIAAQGRGDPSAMKLAVAARYVEYMQETTQAQSILGTPLRIDFHRSLLDTSACETFTEVIVTDKAHPYVLGVRQRVVLGTVSEFDALVTDQGDWLFNADNYLPDSHLFRIENGRIRYVHTLTVCTVPGCGFPALGPPPPAR